MATYKPKKKIDKNGTLEEVKIPIESVDGLADEFNKKGVHFISDSIISVSEGTTSPKLSAKWTVGRLDGIENVFDGMSISIRIPRLANHNVYGVVLSIDGGANYYPLVINRNTLLQRDYNIGSTVNFVFNSSVLAPNIYIEQDVLFTGSGVWQTADLNTDKNVEQSRVTSGDSEYPIIVKNSASASTTISSVGFNPNVTVNHTKGRISATEFRENGVSLADKYALKGESGGAVRKLTYINATPRPSEIDSSGLYIDATGGDCELEYDGSEYEYPDLYVRLPIVSGDGIDIVKTEDNGAFEIKTKLPTEEVEAIDLPTVKAKLTPASEVGGGSGLESFAEFNFGSGIPEEFEYVGGEGLYWRSDIDLLDEQGGVVDTKKQIGFVPICAGQGIEFVQETDEPTVTINAMDREPVYIVGSNADDGMHNVNIATDGIEFTDTYEDEYSDGSYRYPDKRTKIPIIAGEGVEFEKDNNKNVVKINSTVEVPINMFVATTEQEFNSLITIENKGKIISYNNKVYNIVVNKQESNPPQVGDTITELYFNTNISPNLSSVVLYPIRITQEDGTNRILIYNSGTHLYVYKIFSSGATVVYSNSDGWIVDRFVYEQPLTISLTEEEDGWSNFISKTPFEIAEAVEIGGGAGLDNLGYIDAWTDLPYDIAVAGPDGISWNEAYEMNDKDGNVLASGDMAHRIPLQAGEGIEFIPDTENNVVKINATGGSGGGISGAWTSGVGGTLTLPEAGIYQLKTDFSDGTVAGSTTFSQIVCWDGNLPTESATIMTLVESDLMCYRFSIGATGVINVKATIYGQYPAEMDWANMNVEYRKIGEA